MSCSLSSSLSPNSLPSRSRFLHDSPPKPCSVRCSLGGAIAEPKVASTAEPLLLNAVRGLDVERPPVWLMRQAGRYMKSYQLICEKYPSFRDRSENADLVVEISLQPWKVFKPDGKCWKDSIRWFGHVQRRSQNAPVRRCESLDFGEFRRGRPKKCWKDSIQQDINLLGISTELAQCRDIWREKIKVEDNRLSS